MATCTALVDGILIVILKALPTTSTNMKFRNRRIDRGTWEND